QELGQVKHAIDTKIDEIAKLRAMRTDLLQQISKAGDTSEISEARRREELAKALQGIFEAAKSRYRDDLRESVEADASEIFKRLTTESSHTGLRINES